MCYTGITYYVCTNTFDTERLNHMSDNTYNNDFNTTNTNPYEDLNDNLTNLDNTETPQDTTTQKESLEDTLYQNTPSQPDAITPQDQRQDPVTERTEYVIRPEDSETNTTSQDDTSNNDESFTEKISEGFDNFKEKVEDVFDGDDEKERPVDDDDIALQEVLDEPVEDDYLQDANVVDQEVETPLEQSQDADVQPQKDEELPSEVDSPLTTPTPEPTLPDQEDVLVDDDFDQHHDQANVNYRDEEESDVRVLIYADEIESGEEASGDVFQEISHKLDEIIELLKNRNV